MFREAAQAPLAVRAQLRLNDAAIRSLVGRLRSTQPRAVVTLARGSSDSAATLARYLIETHLEILTASAAWSTMPTRLWRPPPMSSSPFMPDPR